MNRDVIALFYRRIYIGIFLCVQMMFTVYNSLAVEQSVLNRLKTKRDSFVKIGSSMPITGPLGVFAYSTSEGVFAALNVFNQEKGIDIPYVREYIFDDMYVPYRTYENIKKFEKEKISVVIMPIGSSNIETYISDIRSGKVLVLFPVMEGRYPDIKNLIHYRATYSEEVLALLDYVSDFKRCAIFYQNDSFGIGPKEAAHKILKEKGIEWLDVPYDRYEVSFSSHAEEIRKFNVDAIIFICSPYAALGVIQDLKPYTLINKKLCGVSDLLLSGFDEQLNNIGLKFIFAATTPNPFKSDLLIAQEYRREMKKHGFVMDMLSFEGFIVTQLFLESLKAASYKMDKEKIVQYFENIQNSNFKGIPLSFSKTRGLSKTVWIVENFNDDWKAFRIKT